MQQRDAPKCSYFPEPLPVVESLLSSPGSLHPGLVSVLVSSHCLQEAFPDHPPRVPH